MNSYPNYRDLERHTGITWQDLFEVEPRLGELLWMARQAGANCLCWSDVDRVFFSIRNRIFELVGFAGCNHRHPVLGSTEAYEVAYWKLYDAVAGLLPRSATRSAEAPEKQCSSGGVASGQSEQFVAQGGQEQLFHPGHPPSDRCPVEDAVVVDDANVHVTVGSDRSVVERGRQWGKRVKRLGPK